MQRFTLSDPRYAAALTAIGCPESWLKVEALHNAKTREKRTSWYVENGVAEVQELLAEAEPKHPKALWRTEPYHPFIAALAGIENLTGLERIKAVGNVRIEVEHWAGNIPILRVDREGGWFSALPPKYAMPSLPHAAALIAVGFIPAPHLSEDGAVIFGEESMTFPGLMYRDCLEAANRMMDKSALTLSELPHFPEGKHPFHFAFSACVNLRLVTIREAEAWKNATHFFQGRGQRCALANEAALDSPFAKELVRHIA